MGTNYYHHTNTCLHCNRADVEHIGKSSIGWTFSFHATDTIRSWKDWQKTLSHGRIFNEYNEQISLNDFIKLVEEKQKVPGASNHALQGYDNDRNFVDEEGYSFSEGEFS